MRRLFEFVRLAASKVAAGGSLRWRRSEATTVHPGMTATAGGSTPLQDDEEFFRNELLAAERELRI